MKVYIVNQYEIDEDGWLGNHVDSIAVYTSRYDAEAAIKFNLPTSYSGVEYTYQLTELEL